MKTRMAILLCSNVRIAIFNLFIQLGALCFGFCLLPEIAEIAAHFFCCRNRQQTLFDINYNDAELMTKISEYIFFIFDRFPLDAVYSVLWAISFCMLIADHYKWIRKIIRTNAPTNYIYYETHKQPQNSAQPQVQWWRRHAAAPAQFTKTVRTNANWNKINKYTQIVITCFIFSFCLFILLLQRAFFCSLDRFFRRSEFTLNSCVCLRRL